MPHVTKILLPLSLIFGMGSMGASITYAWYLHSPLYRDAVQRRISDYLGVPVEIQVVEALSPRSKRLLGIRSYLPDRRDRIFECALAVWQERRGEAGIEYELKLNSGALTIPVWLLFIYSNVGSYI